MESFDNIYFVWLPSTAVLRYKPRGRLIEIHHVLKQPPPPRLFPRASRTPPTSVFQVLTQRAGTPVFDMVIEIKRGEVGTWSIIKNVAVAVDALLEGDSYEVERRSRSERDSQPGNKVRPVSVFYL